MCPRKKCEMKQIVSKRKLKTFMGLIKEKIQCSHRRTIVQLLTLASPSWSILEVQNKFAVTEYQANKAR